MLLSRHLGSLTRRQEALLLSALALGDGDRECFAFLPDEDRAALEAVLPTLDTLPPERRAPLMLRHLRHVHARALLGELEGIEPSWLLHGLKGESPRTVGIVLASLPAGTVRQITTRLPAPLRDALPKASAVRALPLEVVQVVRRRFAAKFEPMPPERVLVQMGFHDVVVLDARELVRVVRRLGTDELAIGFVAVGKRALAAFLSRLPTAAAEELMGAVKRVSPEDQIDEKTATATLGRFIADYTNTDELYQRTGLFRLARGLQRSDDRFARQIAQRFPRAHGRLLLEYLDRFREKPAGVDTLPRLRDQVVQIVVDLSQRGKIDARYGDVLAVYEQDR